MDLDRYIGQHRPAWDRLEHLSRAGGGRGRRLNPAELDELVVLYQAVSGHLAHARTAYGDPNLIGLLTRRVADANAVIYGQGTSPRRALVRFFRLTFPGSIWRIRRFVAVAALLFCIPAVALGAWLANSDAALEASAPEYVRDAYVEQDFEDYYSSEPAAQFTTEVTFNNIQVSVLAFAVGILACVGAAFLMVFNGLNLGVAAGLFYAAGEAPRFWGLILPHGLLEITAVILAGAAGLRLGWTLIDPGDLPRGQALSAEGRRSVTVIMGLVLAFSAAGLIEGFVTGSSLPTPVRVGVGVAVWLGFLTYLWRFGRSAEAELAVEDAVIRI